MAPREVHRHRVLHRRFGDITAKTETARLVVTGQMIADLIVLGIAIELIVGAVKRGRADRGPR